LVELVVEEFVVLRTEDGREKELGRTLFDSFPSACAFLLRDPMSIRSCSALGD
jgi:hypothetical protein